MEHPYVPRDMNLPGFVPQLISTPTIFAVIISASALVVVTTWIASGFIKRRLTIHERIAMCWWMFTGLFHVLVEGYYVFTPDFYKKTSLNYMAEEWKEYGKGDSRYMSRDPGVVAIEGLTAVFAGPLGLLCVYAIARKKPYRHVLQLAIALEELYVTVLLFISYSLAGGNFASSWVYYYGYFVIGNSVWIVIPTTVSIFCWKRISAAIQEQIRGPNRNKAI